MPEGSDPLVERFDSAVAAIESRWEKLGLQPRKLDGRELSVYRGRSPEMGWRFNAEFSDATRRLDIIVTGGFPSVPARVALVDRPSFLTWPHVEKDGVLCLMPDHTTLSVDDPYDGVVSLLDEAFRMIEASIRGELDDDFRAEFLTYWHHAEQGTRRTVLSLVEPGPPSRLVSVWEGVTQTVIAETDNQLRTWLRNFAPKMPTSEIKLRAGVLVWFDEVPLPSLYPSSARQVYDMAARAGAAHFLDDLARETRPRTFIVFGANTQHGPALATAVVNRPKVLRGRDPLVAGFRPSAVPENIVHARLFGGSAADRNSVERVDPAWVHGREQDPRIPKLRGATVAVLGCGSVGAPVALALARAGVGRLVLVDKESLKGANVGRHPLGVGSIGASKTIALARMIRSSLPHLDVTCHVSAVQDVLLRADDPLAKVDLVVSALGDWPAESLLDEWQAAQEKRVPIVYGWTEPHAAAGHAIVVSAAGDRLRAGLDAYGSPRLVAVRWVQETRRYEPACGAAFDPYGPIELGFVTSMVAQTALDALLGQANSGTHRMWLARKAFVEAAGGTWSDELRAIAPQALEGATMVELRWGRYARILAA
jgi:sulfur-carrier protein adenylyltransferase/sulfurtransferase